MVNLGGVEVVKFDDLSEFCWIKGIEIALLELILFEEYLTELVLEKGTTGC